MFGNRNGGVRESNGRAGRQGGLIVAVLLTAACGTGDPMSGPSSPDPAPYLVHDIRPGWESSLTDPHGSPFFALRGRLLFVADDGVHGLELWETDGTAAGTRLVADICPGECSSFPFAFFTVGDTVLFNARDGVHGQELWRTDGTTAGTFLVLDIRPGSESSAPGLFTRLGDQTLFRALGPGALGHGYPDELWTTDGTAEGTLFIREISPAATTRAHGRWVPAGGLVFFAVNDGAVGHELWATDGTAAGTRLVRDICEGPCDGVDFLRGTPLDGVVYFAGRTRDGIREIWRSDGTSPGTFSLGAPFTGDPTATVSQGTLFFAASGFGGARELWKTDGSRRGTSRVSTIEPWILFDWRGRIFGSAIAPQYGQELWASDGTTRGTVLVKDVNPGSESAYPRSFLPHGDLLFFMAYEPAHGRELWQTDGTTEGTRLVADIWPGQNSALSSVMVGLSLGDRILFQATDGVSGQELWAYRPR